MRDSAEELWRKISECEDLYFVHDGDMEIDVVTKLRFPHGMDSIDYDYGERIPLQEIIKDLGRVQTASSVRYLCRLLNCNWRWPSHVYGWARIAGGYGQGSETSAMVMANVYLWMLKALTNFHDNSVVSPLNQLLIRVINLTHAGPFRSILHIQDGYLYRDLIRRIVEIMSNYGCQKELEEAVRMLEGDGFLSASFRESLVEEIVRAARTPVYSKLIQEKLDRKAQREGVKKETQAKVDSEVRLGLRILPLLFIASLVTSWLLASFSQTLSLLVMMAISFAGGAIFAVISEQRWRTQSWVNLTNRGCFCYTPLSVAFLLILPSVAGVVGGTEWSALLFDITAGGFVFLIGFFMIGFPASRWIQNRMRYRRSRKKHPRKAS